MEYCSVAGSRSLRCADARGGRSNGRGPFFAGSSEFLFLPCLLYRLLRIRTVALFCVIGEGDESGTNRKEKAFKRSVRTDMDCSAGSCSTASDLDCFWNNQHLEEVNISGSLTNISGSAFEKCTSLKKVTLGSSVTAVDSYAFKNCENLSELNFDYISNIASYAFENCGFTSLSLSGKEISSHAFNSNKKLEILSLSNVSEIGLGSFKDCNNLSSLSVSNVKIIGSQAFMNDKISSLSFDSSLEEIRSSAFENNQILSISFEEESSLRLISRKAFYNNQIAGNLNLPDSLEYIYAYAFQNNKFQEVSLSEKCSFESNSFDKGINVVIRNENN